MSEQEQLFRMETEPTMTEHEALMQAFVWECEHFDTPTLIALREAELDTLSTAEQRIHQLNVMIDRRQDD